MTRRVLAVVLAGMVVALAAVSCAPRAKPPRTQELVFWQSWAPGVADSLVTGFERGHPGLDVRVQWVNPACMRESLETAFASGRTPDLCQVGSSVMPALLAGGRLADWSAGVADLRDSLRGWQLCSVGDAIYGVPWTLETRALYFNAALLARAGLDPAHPPETWDQLGRAAAAVQRLGHGVRGYGIPVGEGGELVRQLLPLLAAGGGGVLSADSRHAVFDSAANVRAVEFLLRLRRSGTTGRPDSLEREFLRGRLGFLLAGAGLGARIAREAPGLHYGVATVPRPMVDQGANLSWAGGELLVSFNVSGHKHLALDLARYLVRPENARRLAGIVPGVLPATAGADTSAPWRDRPGERALMRQLETVCFTPRHPAWPEMEAALDSVLEQALDGRKSAAQAVRDAQEKLAALVGKR